VFVQNFDLLGIFRRLDQMRIGSLVAVQNGDENIDPVLEASVLNQIRQQLHAVAHVENLGDQDQYSQLVFRKSVGNVGHHHVLQVRDEHTTDFYHDLPF
jgi:hypothetical protein